MRSILDEIIQEATEKAVANSLLQGLQQGLQQGRQEEAVTLVLRLLKRQLGQIDADAREQIQTLPLAQLERLSEDLLDFTAKTDLKKWLRKTAN